MKSKVIVLLLVFSLLCPFISLSTQNAEGWKNRDHATFTERALVCLENDEHDYIVDWLEQMELKQDLISGAYDADKNDLSRNHYYDPYEETGLTEFKSGRRHFYELYRESSELLAENKLEEAMYKLGWALHVLQDMYSPHHTHLDPLNGHSDFESWVSDNMDLNKTLRDGNYSNENKLHPYRWIEGAAFFSYDYYDYIVSDNATEENYTYAWSDLHPKVIQQSAGFLHWYFNTHIYYNVQLYTIDKSHDSLSVKWRMDYAENFESYEIYIGENRTDLEQKIENSSFEKEIYDRHVDTYQIRGLDSNTEYYIKVYTRREGGEDTYTHTLKEKTSLSPVVMFILICMAGATATALALRRDEVAKKMDQVRK